MAIHQSIRQSDLEKHLRLLRHQVYSGGRRLKVGSEKSHITPQYPISHISYPKLSLQSDITHLRQDLTKIAILASFAFAIQFTIFYLLQNNILKINLF